MNTPTHDEIALRASQIWHDRGCPDGLDTEIWLEAERLLMNDDVPSDRRSTAPTFVERTKAETASESEVEYHISPAGSQQESIKAAVQKQDAREPRTPHGTSAPKAKPAPAKPVWPTKR